VTYDDERLYVTVKPEDVQRFLTAGFKIEAPTGVVMSRSIANQDVGNVLKFIAKDEGGKVED
jgi:hypothetical protein